MKKYKPLPYSDLFEKHINEMCASSTKFMNTKLVLFSGVKEIKLQILGTDLKLTFWNNKNKRSVNLAGIFIEENKLELTPGHLQKYWGFNLGESVKKAKDLNSWKKIRDLEPNLYLQLNQEQIGLSYPQNKSQKEFKRMVCLMGDILQEVNEFNYWKKNE